MSTPDKTPAKVPKTFRLRYSMDFSSNRMSVPDNVNPELLARVDRLMYELFRAYGAAQLQQFSVTRNTKVPAAAGGGSVPAG